MRRDREDGKLVMQSASQRVPHRHELARLGRESASVLAGNIFAGAGGFAAYAILARILNVADYGRFSAYLGLMGVCAIASTGWGSAIVVQTARLLAAGQTEGAVYKETLRRTSRVTLVVSIVALIAAVVFGIRASANLFEACTLVTACAGQLQAPVLRSVFQGMRDFRTFTWATVAEFAARLALAPALASVWGVSGALLGFTAGAALSIVVTSLPRPVVQRETSLTREPDEASRGAVTLAITSAVLHSLSNLDVLVVQRVASAQTAGLFAVLSLAGRAEYFGLGFIPAILFPAAASGAAARHRTGRLLAYAVALAAGGSLAVSAIFFLAPRLIIDILGGRAYEAASPHLAAYGLAIGGLLLAHISASYCFAIGRTQVAWCTAVILAAETGILASRGTTLSAAVGIILVGHLCAGIATVALGAASALTRDAGTTRQTG